MTASKAFARLSCWFMASVFQATCLALQTGPPTLENLLNPTEQDPGAREPTPFDKPQPKPDGQRQDAQRPAITTNGRRLAVPEQSAVDEALELIHQAYEETIKAASANPDTAIRTFRDTADKTTDPSRKFALLVLAEQLALEARATSSALDVLARRAALFEMDALAARHAFLCRAARADDSRPDPLLFEHVVETARRAVAADRYDLAAAAADLAESIAKSIEKEEKVRVAESKRKRETPPKLVAAKLVAEASNLQRTVRERRRQAFDYVTARDRLAAVPDDAAAAETVGRYLCFVKNDWKAGLAMLARGRDESLRNLAAREVFLSKEPLATPTDRLKLANEWWKLAESANGLPGEQAEGLKAHASGIYREIAAKLSDPIDAALARKRAKIAETAGVPDAAPNPTAEKPGQPTLDSLLPSSGR